MIGGLNVLQGSLEPSTFLINLAIYRTIGAEFQQMYVAYLNIQSAYAPLYEVTDCLNVPTDLLKRMKVNRERRARGTEERLRMREVARKLRENGHDMPFPIDNVTSFFAPSAVVYELQCYDYSSLVLLRY